MKLAESDSVITLTLAKNSGEETEKPDEADVEADAREGTQTAEAAEAVAEAPASQE